MKKYEQFIAKEDIELIHENTIRILENVGVKFEHGEALEIFRKHGIRVEGDVVYMGEKDVRTALSTVPETFTLYSGRGTVEVGDGSMVRLPVGCPAFIEDHGNIRKILNKDIIDLFKLIDTSPLLDCNHVNFFTESEGFSDDVKRYSYLALLMKYSNKPFPFAIPDTSAEKGSLREAMASGIRLMKRFEGVEDKCLASVGINPLSPLCYDHAPIERIIGTCSENQGIWLASCVMPVLTAPPSVASILTMVNAEILAGFVFTQLLKPGTPMIYANVSGSTDLRTIQLSMGNPEAALMIYGTAALADYYRVPFRAGGAISDAKDLDFQAGMESMMMAEATVEAKPDMILHSTGCLGTYNIVSFEKMLMDEEIFAYAERIHRGIDVTEKKICFKDIEKTGPRGNFLSGRTPKMYREEFYLTQYLNKADANDWQNKGRVGLKENAGQKVQERIEAYQAPEITKEQEELLKPYLPEAYRDQI
ncbi:trimethylamine---corrinoid protein Co-methyltransferase [Eubacterium maltosivorans]|uniref:trimethylamine methyltransferase family protein n=1 Tax=Eubacterium maltosivorans TaxID=2041044 RepID=UPI0008901AA8|nr:trimethylamine methyltransferase family protein [Eubacterium maltosivorans]WPK78663.1 Glycine betaine methyltransferase [Eubacterium maltosivorans]SDO42961.1 trimethylamine---corrinoid protein Co-methyltransferase [Eubacterium maltosivorans]